MSNLHVLLTPSWYPTTYSPSRGSFFREQALALKEYGVQAGVIYPDFRSYRTLNRAEIFSTHFQFSQEIDSGIPTLRFHAWNPLSARLRKVFSVILFQKLWRLYVARWGFPDLIHAHSAVWGGIAARELSLATGGIPYIVTEHSSAFARGMVKSWQRDIIRDVFADASAIVAVSNSLRLSLKPFFPPESQVEIIPNFVDVDFFAPNPIQSQDNVFKFITVAFLNKNKGIDILLRAFAHAFRHVSSDIFLDIGGDGPTFPELKHLTHELGIAERVRFLGYLKREQVRDAMRQAHVFVSSSYVETFGVVLVEAMATGLPVIATRSGGPEEIVVPTVGMLVEPGSVEALAQSMRKMVERYDSFAPKSIRNYAKSRFSKERVISRLLKLYRSLNV